jgi:enediyne biosynthesis protein E4
MFVLERLARGRWRHALWISAIVIVLVALGIHGRGMDPQTEWRIIGEAVAEKRWDEVERRLWRWLKRFPEDGSAWVHLGSVLHDRGRTQEALTAFHRVKEPDAAWSAAQTRIGEVASQEGRLAEAESAFWAAARREPRAVNPRAKLVSLFTIQERPREAQALLWELFHLTRDPRHLAALTGLALTGIDDVGALESLRDRFLRESPTDVWLQRARGISLLRQGRPAEALPYLECANQLENDLNGRFALAECRIALSHTGDLDALLGPLPIRPDDQARRWLLMAQAEHTRGHEDQALANWRRSVAADPENRVSQYRLGQTLVRRGEHAAARPHLERAAVIAHRESQLRTLLSQIGPQHRDDAARYEAIAELCLEASRPAEARAWYEETIRVDPTRSTAQSALARLAGAAPCEPLPDSLPRRPLALALTTAAPVPARTVSVIQPGPRFEDVSHPAGLAFQYNCGATADLFIADTMGGGVGVIDYDNDGWLDLYLVNGCTFPIDPQQPPAPNKLYRNLRNGTFEDVTERAGVGGRGYGMGCAVGDFDDDGHDDLFVTGFRNTLLYRNRGDGTFEDVTKRAGVHSSRWCTAAGFADLDGDRDLDLVVVAYVDADPNRPIPCRDSMGRRIHCTPSYFRAQFNHLFRNNGDGTFSDVTRDAGLELAEAPGLGLAIADLDGDGQLDLFVANDAAPNSLFRNLGRLRFEESGVAAGLAYDGEGHATASMGVVAEDLDGDGLIDIFHTNLINEASTLAHNLGAGCFADVTEHSGLMAPSRSVTGFGTVALDADNDGRLDLFAANGHVDDAPWRDRPMAELPHFYRSIGDGRFEQTNAAATGTYFTRPVVGRGAAVGDLDNDGRLDIVVVHRDRPLAVLRNMTDASHSLGVRLRGKISASTPVGARVTCRVGGRTMVRWVTAGTGYLSANDPRLWFGLGASQSVDRLEVRWPSGVEQKWSAISGNRILEILEGEEPVTRMSLPRR